MGRIARAEHETVREVREQADAVEIKGPDERHFGRRGIEEHSTRVAPDMADGAIERAEQPVVRRREDDQVSAGAQAARALSKLAAVVFDVFEHIDIQDRVETEFGGHRRDGPFANMGGDGKGVRRDVSDQTTHEPGVGAIKENGADFGIRPPQECRDAPRWQLHGGSFTAARRWVDGR